MQIYQVMLIAGALMALLLAVIAWTRKHAPGAPALMVMQVSVAWWLVCYVLPFSWLPPAEGIFLRARLVYLGIVLIPPAALVFALSYTRNSRQTDWRLTGLLAIEPCLAIVAIFWPPTRDLFFGQWRGLEGDRSAELGPLFWVHVLYSYLLLGKAVHVLIGYYRRANDISRRQMNYLLIAVACPATCNLAFVFGVVPSHIDLTPLGLVVSGALLLTAIFNRGLFDLVAVGHRMVGEAITDGFVLVDAQRRVVDSNSAISQILLAGRQIEPGRPLKEVAARLDDILSGASGDRTIVEFQHGDSLHLELRIFSLVDASNELSGHVLIVRDVSDAKRAAKALEHANEQLAAQLATIEAMQAELREQVMRDALTGLYNRRYMLEALNRELSNGIRKGVPFAVVMIDVDHFKSVNDTHGHAAGGAVLQALGKLILQRSRPSDSPCRYGGEEFVILMSEATPDIAIRRTEEWREEFSRLVFAFQDSDVSRTFSAGIAVYPFDGIDEATLLAAADTALYAAKATGRNRVCHAGSGPHGCADAAVPADSPA